MKQTGERSAGKPHATFEAAGTGNEITAAGLRVTAKAVEQPPEPEVAAPDPDPTDRYAVPQSKGADSANAARTVHKRLNGTAAQ
jgi:hypothetical protein